ncbi:hypothetical protein ACNKHT_21810 [Shigella flexneri]
MAEQLDQMGGEQLRREIESMGVRVHTTKTPEIVQEGVEGRDNHAFCRRQRTGSRLYRLLYRYPSAR